MLRQKQKRKEKKASTERGKNPFAVCGCFECSPFLRGCVDRGGGGVNISHVPLRPWNHFLSAMFKENKVSCHHKRLKKSVLLSHLMKATE